MLASLEWVYREALALIIGTLGVLPLSVHTVPTQVMFIIFMFPLGIGIALAIRLGTTMTHNVRRAKLIASGSFLCSAVLFSLTSLLMYRLRFFIFSVFTSEPQVIGDKIWPNVCLYFVNLSMFGVNMGISTGLGMQWTFGIITVVSLWFLGMPASYYFAVVRGGGLEAAWQCIWPQYIVINVSVGSAFFFWDWDEVSSSIRRREGVDTELGTEYTPLTDSPDESLPVEAGG
ncbi:hypothetical protein ACA910_008566 [Epithemia clementina (nom. ined.)]